MCPGTWVSPESCTESWQQARWRTFDRAIHWAGFCSPCSPRNSDTSSGLARCHSPDRMRLLSWLLICMASWVRSLRPCCCDPGGYNRAAFSPGGMMSIAFMFPGQGSQSVGMLSALAADSPSVRSVFDEASGVLGYDLWQLVQSGPAEK